MTDRIKKWDDVHGVEVSDEKLTAFLEQKTDAYAILQLHRGEETAYERFMSYSGLKRQGKEPEFDHYEVVYTGALPAGSVTQENQIVTLEALYEKFNVDHPQDFTGHSLSVSDIVALKVNRVVSCHYVDSFGFQELPGFIPRENYLKNAEMALEDDYNSLDGIVNNGKRQEEPERQSVLEQLKSRVDQEPAFPSCIKKGEREME